MFRKATLNDCKNVYDLICGMESKELPYGRFSGIFSAQLDSGNYYCLIYEEDGKVTGELNLRFEYQLHHADRIAEIMEFAVVPEARDRGVGRAMFEEACRVAKENGCVQIEVACNQLRTDTHRFYLREGMKNYHYKFSRSLIGDDDGENRLGR